MTNMLIVSPKTPAGVATSRGSGTANLLKASPKSVWLDSLNNGSDASIDLDMGADTSIDTIALVGTNAAAAATCTVTSGTQANNSYTTTVRVPFGTTLRAPSDAPAEFAPVVWPALFYFAEPFVARYIRLSLIQPAGAGALQVGCVLAGAAFKPTWNREWESGRGLLDTGSRTRLPDGGLAAVDGVAVPTFDFVLGDLTDAEVAWLWALKKNRRTTRPALVVEDPDLTAGLAERVHYGTFTAIEAYSRRQVNKSRWAFQFEDWL